jgi:hypothetical protein
MSQDPLPYPPRMRNGGSPPAHLSSSSLSDTSGWMKYKWSQPPPRAPDWVFHCYQNYKAVNALWEYERRCLQTAACQRHLNKQAACKQQEAAHRQRLLNKRATYKHQEAARCQQLHDEETAQRQRLLAASATQSQWTAAATTIFLWLHRRRVQIRLAQMTARRQQCEAALACLRYEQECCTCTAMVEKQQ